MAAHPEAHVAAGGRAGEVEDSMAEAEGVAEATMLSRPDAADHRNMEE